MRPICALLGGLAFLSVAMSAAQAELRDRAPAGYAVTSPHPDQGLITALPMEVTAVVTRNVLRLCAAVARTNWRETAAMIRAGRFQ